MKPRPIARGSARTDWLDFLEGRNPAYPEQALERDLDVDSSSGSTRCARIRRRPTKRLADNMLDYNPAATDALVQLMWGALLPGP